MFLANNTHRIGFLITVLVFAPACDSSPAPPAKTNLEKIREEMAKADAATAGRSLPELVIELPCPAGWESFEPRPLPVEDDGLSIAFKHESGVTVTFYQYTRKMKKILRGTSSATAAELGRAKNGIKEMVALKMWDAAEEIETEETPIGVRGLQGAWSRYHLAKDDKELVSDIYVWGHKQRIFKIRATGNARELDAYEAAMKSLLDACGEACVEE